MSNDVGDGQQHASRMARHERDPHPEPEPADEGTLNPIAEQASDRDCGGKRELRAPTSLPTKSSPK